MSAMFSGITNLLFGHQSGKETPQEASTTQSQAESAFLTTSPDESNEWLLIDRSDARDDNPLESFTTVDDQDEVILSSASTPAKSDSVNTSGSEETSDFESFQGPFLCMQDIDPQSDTALSDVSSQPEHVTHPSLEECWIVTPPPCFTACESTSNTFDMHPLENLLIEHPSMSVYCLHNWTSLDADLDPDNVHEQQEQLQESQPAQLPADVQHDSSEIALAFPVFKYPLPPQSTTIHSFHGMQHHSRVTLGHPLENQQLLLHRCSLLEEQKSRKRFIHQKNSRKYMQQQNRVLEFVTQGKIRARKDRMFCHSGRSNNRKC